MIRNTLESIDQVAIYPIISFLIFFFFFIMLTIYVVRMDRTFIDDMKSKPLHVDDKENKNAIIQ